jgi:dTDP-4-dehydrorhamnose reductase
MKVVVTGKHGLLTSELQKIDDTILGLSKEYYDITKLSIISKLNTINPDIIIHSSAITDSKVIIKEPILSIKTNIIGSANISEYCLLNNKRLIYISTDYVYPGLDGNYKESDPVLPVNEYAWTKLGGECSVRMVKNHLIIRTSFGPNVFPYDQAWGNQIVSKDYIDIIAPKILKAAKSNINGVLNIGTEPKTIFDYAYKRNNLVKKVFLKEKKNFSLNLEKYEKL